MKTNVLLLLLCCLAVQIQAKHNEKVWMGNLTLIQNDVAGKVYAIANDMYLITNFSYNGVGPDVFLYYGSETSLPDASGKEATIWEVVDGEPIEDPLLMFPVEGKGRNYSNTQLAVKLLPGDSVCTVKWISIWCKAYAVDFGNAVFSCEKKADATATFCPMCPTPPPTPPPAEVNEKVWMGNLTLIQNDVAGKVFAIANDTYLIKNFSYNGVGPDVFLYYGSETSQPDASGKEATIWEVVDGEPIENPLLMFPVEGKERNYSNTQLAVKLLPGDSVCTVKWISVWCKAYAVDFGNAVFPSEKVAAAAATFCPNTSMTVAPPTPTPTPTPTPGPGMPINCETLTNKYAMCWKNNGNSTSFTLCNANIAAGQYMGFGFSKLETPSKMIGSDVTICSFQQNSLSVRDYFLESKMVCKQKRERQARGVCPDTNFGGSDQLSNKAIGMQDGTAWCSFTRSITSSDSPYDRNITNPQPIVWAMGPLKNKRVLKHTKRNNGPAQTIDFSSGGGTQQDGKKCDMVSHCQDMLAMQ